MRTSASEVVNEIITDTIVLARIWFTIIDIEFAVLALISFWADALVSANEIFAGGSILARIGSTLINFFLAVTSLVSIGANTFVTESNVSAMTTILAKLIGIRKTSQKSGSFAGNLANITKFASPSSLTFTFESSASLLASGSVFAGGVPAPIYHLLAVCTSPSVRTMTSVRSEVVVNARTSILARILVAL